MPPAGRSSARTWARYAIVCCALFLCRHFCLQGDAAFKAAGHERKSLDVLRALCLTLPGFVAPLAACVDFFGHRFLCTVATDLSYNTLAYGSSTDGLIVKDSEQVRPLAQALAEQLNLAALCRGTAVGTTAMLRCHTRSSCACTGTSESYVTVASAGRLLPPDAPGGDKIDQAVKLLRPEFVRGYGFGEQVKPGYRMYTSVNPCVCDSCAQVILEFEFYNYDKRGTPAWCPSYVPSAYFFVLCVHRIRCVRDVLQQQGPR